LVDLALLRFDDLTAKAPNLGVAMLCFPAH
jgi:hypothetical protein